MVLGQGYNPVVNHTLNLCLSKTWGSQVFCLKINIVLKLMRLLINYYGNSRKDGLSDKIDHSSN